MMSSGHRESQQPWRVPDASSRSQYRRRRLFVSAVGVAALLVIALTIAPAHDLLSGGGTQRSAAAPKVAATTTTSIAPATTTIALGRSGLGLPPQPTPTPVPLPATNLAPVFSRIPTPNNVIFLGIDDGIVRDPGVLKLLKQANIPFSIFLTTPYADAGVDFWKQAQTVGGIIESHSVTHPDLTKVSAARLQPEICGTLDDYQTLFGRRPTLFRPPYGSYNQNVQAVAASCGFHAIILWKGSTNDGRFDLQEGPLLHPGDIVLMHWRTDLYKNLQKVFQTCREQGFAIARIEDYLR